METEPGVRVYHSGDSAVFGDMRFIGELHRPTIGLIGCSQPYDLLPSVYPGAGEVVTGEMDPEEAAIAAELLGVKYAIGSHFDDTERARADVARFLAAVVQRDTTGQRVPVALKPNQVLVIDGDRHHVEEARA